MLDIEYIHRAFLGNSRISSDVQEVETREKYNIINTLHNVFSFCHRQSKEESYADLDIPEDRVQ